MIAPTSSDERVERIVRVADGFLYLVSVAGVTGVRNALSSDLGVFIERVRTKTELSLYVGFGVSDRQLAAEVTRHADGVIIGSAIIRIVESSASEEEAVAAHRCGSGVGYGTGRSSRRNRSYAAPRVQPTNTRAVS